MDVEASKSRKCISCLHRWSWNSCESVTRALIFTYTFLPIISWWEGVWAGILDCGFSPQSAQVGQNRVSDTFLVTAWIKSHLKLLGSKSHFYKVNILPAESHSQGKQLRRSLCLAAALKRKGRLEQIAPTCLLAGKGSISEIQTKCQWPVNGCLTAQAILNYMTL